MRHMRSRRILAMLLALSMIFGLLTTTALADNGVDQNTSNVGENTAENQTVGETQKGEGTTGDSETPPTENSKQEDSTEEQQEETVAPQGTESEVNPVSTYTDNYATASYELNGETVTFEGETLRDVNNAMRTYWEVGDGSSYNAEKLPADGTGTLTWKIYGTVEQGDYSDEGALVLPALSGGYIYKNRTYQWSEIKVEAGNDSATIVSNTTFDVHHSYISTGTTSTTFNGITFDGGIYAVPRGTLTFDSCTFTGQLRVPNGDGKTVVTGCTFSGTTAKQDTNGYVLHYQAGGELEFTGNTVESYARGLNIDNEDLTATVSDNKIAAVTDTGRSAIQISQATKLDVTNNNIALNGGNAFTLHESLLGLTTVPEISITGNTITGTGYLIYDDAAAHSKEFNSENLTLTFDSTNTVPETVNRTQGVKGTKAPVAVSPVVSKATSGTTTETVVATIGSNEYTSLNAAIKEVADGQTIVVNAGTYVLPASDSMYTGKAFTIEAASDAEVHFTMPNEYGKYIAIHNAKVTFNNIIFDYGTADYVGLAHADTLEYNKCTINGKVFLYANSETFNDCTFIQENVDYNVWTYGAQKTTFNRCTFNCKGKAVLVYNEGHAESAHNPELIVIDTKFDANGEKVKGKAAIEIDTSLMEGTTVTIDDKTTVVSGFDNGNKSGNKLWNDKKQNAEENKNTTVIVAGDTVFAPKSEGVATVDGVTYDTLDDALKYVTAGTPLTWVDESVWAEATPVYYAGHFYSNIDELLYDAHQSKGVIKPDSTDEAVIYCRPNANITNGNVSHPSYVTNTTIYGNGATLSGATEWDVENYYTLTKDITINIYNLNGGASVWGTRESDYTVTVNMIGCEDAHEVLFNYGSGNGRVIVTVKDCTFLKSGGAAHGWPVSINCLGSLTVDGCTFDGVITGVVVNVKQPSENGKMAVSVKNSTFNNITGQDQNKGALRVTGLQACDIDLTIDNVKFTGTHAEPEDITIGNVKSEENLGKVSYNISNTKGSLTAHKVGETTPERKTLESTESYTGTNSGTTAADSIDLDKFLTWAATNGWNVDGSNYTENMSAVQDGKLVVEWSPVSGCYDTRDGHTCTVKNVKATGNTPKRVNNSLTQFQILEGADTAVTVKNVKFVYEPADFTVCANSGWKGSFTAEQAPAGQLYFMTTGDVTFESCDFDKVVLTTFNTTGTSTVTNCNFANVYNNYAIKDIRGANVSVTGTTITNCGGGIMVSQNSGVVVSSVTLTNNTFTNVDVEGTAAADKVGTRAILQFASSGDYAKAALDFSGNNATNCGPVVRQLNNSAVDKVKEQEENLTGLGSTLFTTDSIKAPTFNADDTITNVTAKNVQDLLDGKYGSIDGKTIVLSAGEYPQLELGRATKYADSNTTYHIGSFAADALTLEDFTARKAEGGHFYIRTMENVTFKAEENATVKIAGVFASSGHKYVAEGSAPVTDYVLDTTMSTPGSSYYLADIFTNIAFEGITFTAKSDINTAIPEAKYDGFTFRNCIFDINNTADGNQAIRYYNENDDGRVTDLTVDTCTFNSCYQGVYTSHVKSVTVTNSKFDTTAHNAIAIQDFKGECDHGQVIITGNTFKNVGDRIIRFNNVGAGTTIQITGNTSVASGNSNGEIIKAETMAEGVTVDMTSTANTWGDKAEGVPAKLGNGFADSDNVAKVGETEYATLEEAIANAEDGQTVTLIADVNTPDTTYVVSKNLTIDLSGKTVTGYGYDGVFQINGANAKVLIKNGNVVAVEKTGSAGKYAMAVWACAENCVVTLEGLTVTQNITHTDDKQMDMIYTSKGTIIINSGSFTSGTPAWTLNCKDSAYKDGSATIIVNGGTFTGFDPNVSPEQKDENGNVPSFAAPGVGITKNADGTFTAKAGMVAQVLDATGSSVKAYASLADAITAAEAGQTVRLLANATENVTIADNKNLTLDLNGHTINGGTGNTKATITNNGTVTITDKSTAKTGTIKRDDNGTVGETSYYVIRNIGTMTIEQANVTNNSGYRQTNPSGSMNGSSLICNGDGDVGATLTINGGTFKQMNFLVVKNGTLGTLNVTGGTFTSKHSAIQNWFKANITGGEINGQLWTDAYIAGASVGHTTIGGSAKYTGEIVMDITGSSVKPTLEISGGTLDVTSWRITAAASKAGAKPAVSGGTFSSAIPYEYCADGFIPEDKGEGKYGVKAGTYVAEVNGAYYESLQAAIDAATYGKIVTLLSDTRENVTVAGKTITLDLYGHTLNGGTVAGTPALTVSSKATLTIVDSSETQTGTIMREDTAENSGVSSHYVIDIQGTGTFLRFKSGNVVNNSGNADMSKGASLIRIGDDGTTAKPQMTITGGTFTQDNFIAIKVDRGVLNMQGGTVNSANTYAVENWYHTTITDGTINGKISSWVWFGGNNTDNYININGGTINGDIESVTYDGTENKTAKITINGGTITGKLLTRDYNKGDITDATKATIGVVAGNFSEDPTKFLVEGSTVTPNADGRFDAVKAYLCKIGDTSYYTIGDALKAVKSGETIVLLRDCSTNKQATSGTKDFTIDLAGFTWNHTGSSEIYSAFEANNENGKITVKNGNVVSNQPIGLVSWDNANLVFDAVKMSTTGRSGIETNGTNSGINITLKNCELNVPNGFGIYFPSSGKLTIENSTINAKTMGVQVCSGSLNITGESTAITVTGDGKDKTENDGAIEDGAVISIVNRTGYKGLEKITVTEGTFKAKEGNAAVKAYNWENKEAGEATFTASDKVAISGGSYSTVVPADLCAEGFVPVTTPNTDGLYEITKDTSEAKIGDTKYATLADALKDATSGNTIVLLNDVTHATGFVLNDGILIDLNGHNLTTPFIFTSIEGGAGVVDTSNTKNNGGIGTLKVQFKNSTMNCITMPEIRNGTYFPIYAGEESVNGSTWHCYKMYRGVVYNEPSTTGTDTASFSFRVIFADTGAYSLIKTNSDQISIRLDVFLGANTEEGNDSYTYFAFNQAFVNKWLNLSLGATGGAVFKVTFTGLSAYAGQTLNATASAQSTYTRAKVEGAQMNATIQ